MPARPKRPLNPYFRFLKDNNTPPKSQSRITTVTDLAARWNAADEATKAKYTEKFLRECERYKLDCAEYKKRITKEQLNEFKLEHLTLKQKKIAAKERKQEKDARSVLGKPKKPLSAFLLFARELRMSAPNKVRLSEISDEWRNLSDAEQYVYLNMSKELYAQYR